MRCFGTQGQAGDSMGHHQFLYALRREVLRNAFYPHEMTDTDMFLYALRREVLRNPVPRDVDVLHHTFLYALRREVLRNTAILMVRCVVLPGHLRGGGDQSTPDRLVEIGREFPQADFSVLQRGE